MAKRISNSDGVSAEMILQELEDGIHALMEHEDIEDGEANETIESLTHKLARSASFYDYNYLAAALDNISGAQFAKAALDDVDTITDLVTRTIRRFKRLDAKTL